MNDKWEFFKDNEKKWRWRRAAPNGDRVGVSVIGYEEKIKCIRDARLNGLKGKIPITA